MARKVSKIWDGTDPGGTPGRVFTASIGQENIIPEGKFLDYLKVGLKGAVSTSAVVVETFAGILSEYTLRAGADFRIIGSMLDLVALSAFFYGVQPTIGENTDATGTDFIGGVMVPVQSPASADKPFTHTATYATQTNIATETIGITGYWDDDAAGKKPIHAVVITHTSAGSAGYETLSFRIAPLGKLIGIILGSPAASGFTDANIDVSVQRLRILVGGQLHSQFNALTDHTPSAMIDFVTPNPMADLMRNYQYYDFRPSGIDTKGQEVTLQIDVEDVSDALRIIPVIEIA